MFTLLTLLASFVLLAVLYTWATATFPALARRRRWVAGALIGFCAVNFVVNQIVIHLHVLGGLRMALSMVGMGLDIAAIPIGLLHGVLWLTRRARTKPAPEPAAEPTGMSRRQVVEAVGGAAFLTATGSMLGWGMTRGRHGFQVDELPVRLAKLPRALDGYVIAQISDIHTGTYVGERELDEGLEHVRLAKPDLLVVTGDLVDFDPAFAPLIARKLAAIAPRDGVFACLGNHDYYAGADRVASILREAGVDMLVNDGRVVRARDGGGFALLGVDDLRSIRYRRGGPQLDAALARVPEEAARILLSHQPSTVDEWAGRVDLQLSGHTHGGQINPGFRPADVLMHYVAGQYPVNGTLLYVNRGFGTVGPPARVGAPPEVTRIVLVAA
jgi:predicted MPP superfamily phosphohydrolase